MGCLAERYRIDLEKGIPEVDRFFGTHQLADVLEELGGHLKKELLGERVLTTPGHSAYLKISEGCDHPCSFCAIPLMRGKHLSRPLQDILDEAEGLARGGVKELVVIAQDTTAYGRGSPRKAAVAGTARAPCRRRRDRMGAIDVRVSGAFSARSARCDGRPSTHLQLHRHPAPARVRKSAYVHGKGNVRACAPGAHREESASGWPA